MNSPLDRIAELEERIRALQSENEWLRKQASVANTIIRDVLKDLEGTK